MKRFLFFAFLSFMFFSCKKNSEEANSLDSTHFYKIGLEVKDVKPLDKKFYFHAQQMVKGISFLKTEPNISESLFIEYEGSPIKAILTPLIQNESSFDLNHIFFEKDGLVSTFSLLLSIEKFNDNTFKYSFLTLEGTLIFCFNLDDSTNLLSGFEIGDFDNGKNWFDRFGNCLQFMMNQLMEEPAVGLVCMAWGKICAPSIAALCAIGATEGYFEEPGQPK